MKMKHPWKIIISGGGTGGHVFPALAIADALRKRYPEVEILFVGAQNRMEMERVPEAGYKIVGLPVAGFDRRSLFRNIPVVWKLYRSLSKARRIVRDFRPDIAIGVGGYASGPVLKAAARRGIPTLIQEQNSYAGVTNKLLARKAVKICVAYEGMERFFPEEKIVRTGNPVRSRLAADNAREAHAFFEFDPHRKTILIVGGSLGARTLNDSLTAHIEAVKDSGVQFIWQTGRTYYTDALRSASHSSGRLCPMDFISRMDLAYAAADLVISRAGAGAIAELSLLGKPAILVPSPNVAEDHQTKNAQALAQKDAAILIPDREAVERLIPDALALVRDDERLRALSDNIRSLAMPDAADRIVDEIEKILQR